MTATEMVRVALTASGKTQRELGEEMGWTPQNTSYRLKAGTLTFDEVTKALSFCGYGVRFEAADGSGLPKLNNSLSPRARKTVGGITYDTCKAESLCSRRESNDGDFYTELFRDVSGAYFTVSYELWDGVTYTITPVSNEAAKRIWASYTGRPDSEMA